MDNLEKYQEVFVDIFDVQAERLNDKFTFEEISCWDSITHMSLISRLEDTFDIMFETEEILHFGSYNNGIQLLRNKGVVI